VVLAAVSPIVSSYSNPYNPNQQFAAGPDALPSWVKFFPGYSNLPPNMIYPVSVSDQSFKNPGAIAEWNHTASPGVRLSISYAGSVGPTDVPPTDIGAFALTNTGNGAELLNISGSSTSQVDVILSHTFSYEYSPPSLYYAQVIVNPQMPSSFGYAVALFLRTPGGVYLTALSANLAGEAALEAGPGNLTYSSYFSNLFGSYLRSSTWQMVQGYTRSASYMPLAYFNKSVSVQDASQSLFASKGTYTEGEIIMLFPHGEFNVALEQTDLKFMVFGSVYGVLGTDVNGGSVWSEFASGTKYAMVIGFGSGVISIAIAIVVGLIAGFFAGIVDSVLLFVIDLLILLPGLVLLIDLDTIFTVGHVLPNKVLLIVVLLSALGWPFAARIFRSQVLSLRKRTYIEASQTMGASNLYIIKKHIFSHTASTIIAVITYAIPGLVIADAGLDFLGLGIDRVPTWGNVLAKLINEVTPTNQYLWWISIPFGLALIFISVGFYLFGTAVQEEFSRLG
jgi:peptide/nickel transport system permease protein